MEIYICTDQSCAPKGGAENLEVLDWTSQDSKKCSDNIKKLWQKHWGKKHDGYVVLVSEKTIERLPSRFPHFRKEAKRKKKELIVKFLENSYVLFDGDGLHNLTIR